MTLLHDRKRTNSIRAQIATIMADGVWRTPREIYAVVQRGSDSTITAKLRDLRHMDYTVDCRHRSGERIGVNEYRVTGAGEQMEFI